MSEQCLRCTEGCVERVARCVERLAGALHQRRAGVELERLASTALEQCICDPKHKGKEAEVSRFCVSGRGTALGSVGVEQEAAYWEVEVVTLGSSPFRVGLAHPARSKEDLARLDQQLGDQQRSWAMSSGGLELKEGSTVGVFFDQRELPTLKFAVDGEMVDESRFVKGVKGDVRPAVSLEKGTILKFRFDAHSFKHKPQGSFSKFDAIIPARSVIGGPTAA